MMRTVSNTETHKDDNQNDGMIFLGKVSSSDAATHVIKVDPRGFRGMPVVQGIPLSDSISGLLGFKESRIPQVGSDVLCYYAGPNRCYIIGCITPTDYAVTGGMPRRSLLGAGDGNNDSQNTVGYIKDYTKLLIQNNTRPTDITEAEWAMSNEFGVLLGLFQQFAMLKASELAQIQCHVLDDLVRIVSHNFQHYTCLGEFKVFHDGRGMYAEFGATHDPSESLGVDQVVENGNTNIQETRENKIDDSENFYKLKDNERVIAIERFKGFVGALGDFVNLMLVRPVEGQVRALDGVIPKTPETGLFNMHVAQDGGLYVRSRKGIFFEKTNWIRVPMRITSPDDPQGDDDITYDKKEAYEFDDRYNFQSQPFLYCLQMRDYLAYVQEQLGYQNFKSQKKDFYVNDDVTKEKKVEEIKEIHKDCSSRFEPRVSGMYMMPNGGLMFKDAWGSAIIMEGGNMYLQPAKDILLQPLRNLVVKTGKLTSIAGKGDIEISSTEGAARIKTEGVQQFYSKNGGIILQTDVPGGPDYSPTDDAIKRSCGIVMSAPLAGIYSYSKENFIRATQKSLNYSANIMWEAQKFLGLWSDNNLIVNSAKNTIIASNENSVFVAEKSAVFVGRTATVVSKEKQVFGVDARGIPVYGLMKESDVSKFFDQVNELDDYHVLDYANNFRESSSFDSLLFRFPKSDTYGVDVTVDVIPMSIAQQEGIVSDAQLITWTEQEVNGTYPYPGKDNESIYATRDLQNLEKIQGELYNKTSELEKEGKIDALKSVFTDYKVMS